MKPILFNTEMVRAILEGRKTVTRRVVKPQPERAPIPIPDEKYWLGCFAGDDKCRAIKPPYRPGDILYVRETFRIDYLSNIPGSGRIHYKADDTYADFSFSPARYEMMRRAQLKPGWRPNENMPREAARIFLRVTDVRVERLQEITPDQLRAEGLDLFVTPSECKSMMNCFGAVFNYERKKKDFSNLWDNIIKKADHALYGWEANPWIWVIEFE